MHSFIGIDLGTTFSVVSKIDEHGKPIIVADHDGKNLTPSCITWDDGKVEIGNEFARREVYSELGDAVGFFKRKMGTSEIYHRAGKDFIPTELSAMVLKHMVNDRAEQIGEIEEVVITVPANFANEAREATLEAAKRAGLKVNYIINEPTAAALHYSFKEGMNLEGVYAIFDAGGGTFDISIIRISGKDVEVLASNGIHKLGGIDFDKLLKRLVGEKYQEVTGEVMEEGDFSLYDAEEQKKELSNRSKISFRVNRKTVVVTREEFEELISSKITQAEMLCESTLEEVGLSPSDINGVLCAGGSTRIPLVQESIRRVFDQEPIFKANVDEVVALGAALYAAYRTDSEKLTSTQRDAISGASFTERTSKYYGIVSLSSADSEKQPINSILIKKGSIIPCEVSEPYFTVNDNQTAVDCRVTESSSEETDLNFVHVVAERELSLPPGRPANQEILVTFRYTENQTMRCSFKDVDSGEEVEILHEITAKTNSDSAPSIEDFKVD